MTELEASILRALGVNRRPWLRPMDFGGRDGSAHAVTAKRMIKKGWVERDMRELGATLKPTYLYRITDKGVRALENFSVIHSA
jgi:DNA-binding MarR family transcriptional regulator